MSSLQALLIGISTSLLTGATLQAAIARPLRAFIASMCPEPESVAFWLRFTIVMLFLSPLFVTVAFGLPAPATWLDPVEIVQRTIASSLVAAFVTMIGIGLWISSLARRARVSAPPAQRNVNPNEFWGAPGK